MSLSCKKCSLFVPAVFCAVLCCAPLCHAEAALSSGAAALIDSFFDLRMNLSLTDGSSEAGEKKIIGDIGRFYSDNEKSIRALTEQEQLVLENFIIMEKYNYLYEKPGQAKVQHEILGKQRARLEAFAQSVPDSQLSGYFLCTWADVTSCYMGYSVSDVLKYGAGIKPLYEKALEREPELSYALTNLGQWYYFAPGITGGSKKKALACFEKARGAARTDSQKYFADIFLSQLLFERKEYGRCRELLSEAESFCPGSLYLARIRSANESGLSLYEYNRKKSDLDKEASKK